MSSIFKGLQQHEGQIYSTGGGAGQSYRKFVPKSAGADKQLQEYNTDPINDVVSKLPKGLTINNFTHPAFKEFLYQKYYAKVKADWDKLYPFFAQEYKQKHGIKEYKQNPYQIVTGDSEFFDNMLRIIPKGLNASELYKQAFKEFLYNKFANKEWTDFKKNRYTYWDAYQKLGGDKKDKKFFGLFDEDKIASVNNPTETGWRVYEPEPAGLTEGNPVNVWAYTGQASSLPPDMKISPLPIDIIGDAEKYIVQRNTYDITKGKAARDLFYNTTIDKANLKTELEKEAIKSKLRKDANGQWVFNIYAPLLQHQKQALKYHLKHLEYMFGDPIKKEKVPRKTKEPEVQAESGIMHGLRNILKQNPKGSAAEKILLGRFLGSDQGAYARNVLGKNHKEWIKHITSWLKKNQPRLQQEFDDVDFTDLESLAYDMYENYLAKQGQLEEGEIKKESSILKGIQEETPKEKKAKDQVTKEIDDLIKKIWSTEEPNIQDQGRYLVHSVNSGLELDTDNLEDAVFSARTIAKRNLDSPALVYDRKTKFPVVSYQGSEDMWYQTNPNSPRLHEEDMIEGYNDGTTGGAGLGIEKSPMTKVLEKPLLSSALEEVWTKKYKRK